MSFFSDLAKGFVHSAVNQVGRDGGKVISNKIYGDLHSTPIRNVFSNSKGDTFFDEETQSPIPYEELADKIEKEGFDRSVQSSGIPTASKVIAVIAGTFLTGAFVSVLPFLALIPSLIFLWLIAKKFGTRNKAIISKSVEVPTYVTDHRCKDGKRFNGYQQRTFHLLVPATDKERNSVILKCIGYCVICAAMLFTGLYWAEASDTDTQSSSESVITPVNADSIVNSILNDTI